MQAEQNEIQLSPEEAAELRAYTDEMAILEAKRQAVLGFIQRIHKLGDGWVWDAQRPESLRRVQVQTPPERQAA